ncbi:MAG: regulatory protein RecX [Anaerofustis stercorihominis]|nr:regulatory protein RecX [Anaerofustis stercorihominis]
MKVTEFEQKKKHCLVTFENGRTFVVSHSTVKKFGIGAVSEVILSDVLEDNEEYAYEYALDYAFRLLGMSAKTYREMKNKLYDKNLQTSAVNSVMSRLEELGYINDKTYAEDFVEYKMESGLSKRAISSKLKEKGVDEDLIKSALEIYPDNAEYEFALCFAKKTAEKSDALSYEKLRNRIYSRLASKGFDNRIIFSVLDEIKQQYNDSVNNKDEISRTAARMYMRGKTREEIFDTLLKKNSASDYADVLNEVVDELFS